MSEKSVYSAITGKSGVDLSSVRKVIEASQTILQQPEDSESVTSSENPVGQKIKVMRESIKNADKAADDMAMSADLTTIPIVLPKIIDNSGRLSALVSDYANKINAYIVPLDITPIQSEVKELKNYNIYEFGGKRYATSKEIHKDCIMRFVAEITAAVSNGEKYTKSLLKKTVYEGEEITNLVMTPEEWSLLCSKFSRYGATVIQTDTEEFDMQLVVVGWLD